MRDREGRTEIFEGRACKNMFDGDVFVGAMGTGGPILRRVRTVSSLLPNLHIRVCNKFIYIDQFDLEISS